jgi:quercetin dioxygenase-like cupin family protein
MHNHLTTAALIAGLALFGGGIADAQQAPAAATQGASNIKRTPLQKFDVPGTNMETVMAAVEIVPNVNIGRHMHPGIESAYLLEGEVMLIVEGQPDKTLKAGESWQIAVGVPHDGKTGATGAKLIVTYVVEKGKPLAVPVAAK